jgi:hypothetical protein
MPIALLVVVLLLCILGAAWWMFKSRGAKAPNVAPVAALRLESIDQTNRVATLSDGGSRDPDGTIKGWRIAWGDGQEDNLSAVPRKTTHTYSAEGDYTISLWCTDNLGAGSSSPATTNISFDLLKRQKALEQAQADAKREADRLKAEDDARKEAARLEEQRQKDLAAMEAQKAREQQALEEKRKAAIDAELARQKAKEAAETPVTPPTPLAAALPDNPSSRRVIYTPPGSALGEFQISKEQTEGMGPDSHLLVILATRCVNFPDTPIPTSTWQIDGKDVQLQAGRIRASLSPGKHEVTALLAPKAGSQPMELKADVTARTSGDCDVFPKK